MKIKKSSKRMETEDEKKQRHFHISRAHQNRVKEKQYAMLESGSRKHQASLPKKERDSLSERRAESNRIKHKMAAQKHEQTLKDYYKKRK